MAIDRKYGRVTLERGTVGEDEPVVVFRAQDVLLPQLLRLYLRVCIAAGSPPHHLDGIDATWDDVVHWQREHRTQVPRSDPPEEVGP
jgi:hypothetical protein